MKISGCLVVALAFLALVQGQRRKSLLQDGKEYKYKSEMRIGTGTMDYAPHLVGGVYRMNTKLQVSNTRKTLKIALSSIKKSEYMGPVDPSNQNTNGLSFVPADQTSTTFQVDLNPDGSFASFKTATTDANLLNIIRGWASLLQVKRQGNERSYVSEKEKTVQGECNVKYAVSPNAIYKSVVHLRDCTKRPIRVRDDWGGINCDRANHKEHMDGIVSSSNTIFNLEDDGQQSYKIKEIVMYGAIVTQMFEAEGVSHLSVTNVTHTLVHDGPAGRAISTGGSTHTSLAYEFADGNLQWDSNRNLKAQEPFFSSGQYLSDIAGSTPQTVFKNMIEQFITTMKTLENRGGITEASVRKAHFMGINRLAVPVFAMDYNGLKGLYDELKVDTSEKGVEKFQIFRELLGAAGSSAAAVLVTDMIKQGELEDRDAARMLTSIPYHIRFPSKQLMEQNYMGGLIDMIPNLGLDKRFTKMAIPLALGHMVRRTCERAGENHEDFDTKKQCVRDLGATWARKFKALYDGTNNKEEKSQAINALLNMRWGVLNTVKPIVRDRSADPAIRVMALWAGTGDLLVKKEAKPLAFELYADATLDHEIRIAAVQMIFYAYPASTDIAQVVAVLRNEKDYELINFVFALMDRYANDIEPCSKKTSELSAYFLKYLKQLTGYKIDWGFGVSKTYKRTFVKEKYGYSGSYTFFTVGSEASTTPLTVGMELDSTLRHSYKTSLLGVYLRIEGLAKGLIRKFKTMDAATWKTEDLSNILTGQMGIAERPEQPVRVQVTIAFKGNIVIHRMYDSGSAQDGGTLSTFVEKIKDMGNNYAINHQRVVPVGSVVVEQPNAMGIPTAYVTAFTTMADLHATVKRGTAKGTHFRKVNYDIKLFTQGMNGMMVKMPGNVGRTYLVNQDRIYYAHFPREVTVGVNLLKKELKLDIGRPEYNHPLVLLMHSATYVGKREHKLQSRFNMNPANTVIVTKGPNAPADRTFVNVEDTTSRGHGMNLNGKYFECEMDVARRNTMGRGLAAFMPYNKSPKTPWTMFSMGMRQIRAFLIYFPKAQQCGARLYWSQSQTKPVTSIIISITGKKLNIDKSQDRGFWRASNIAARISITGKGETPSDARRWKIEIKSKRSAGNRKKQFEITVKKKFPAWVVDAAKQGCMKVTYKADYPAPANEFMGVDFTQEMEMNGGLQVKYGSQDNCDGNTDGNIKVDFKYKTRTHLPDVKTALEGKWYYQKCMADKNTPAWQNRPAHALPMTMECFYTAYDATVARDYFWDVQFIKVTDRAKEVIKKIRTIVNFAVLTVRGTDLGYTDPMVDLDPRLRVHAIIKDGDSKADITVENARMIQQNKKAEIKDYDLKLSWGPKMLRNLKFGGMLPRLMKMGVIKPCVATIDSVLTMDNVTYSYSPTSCKTLISGHCAANPSYAVFTKKSGSELELTAFIGGHKIEIAGGVVKINGATAAVPSNGPQKIHKSRGTEIFSIFKWGNTYSIYSFLKVWIVFDGSYVEVIPAPSVKGNHCGMCGNFNRNQFDEFTKKDGTSLAATPAEMVSEYCWP
jgi:hypothetical protein